MHWLRGHTRRHSLGASWRVVVSSGGESMLACMEDDLAVRHGPCA